MNKILSVLSIFGLVMFIEANPALALSPETMIISRANFGGSNTTQIQVNNMPAGAANEAVADLFASIHSGTSYNCEVKEQMISLGEFEKIRMVYEVKNCQ